MMTIEEYDKKINELSSVLLKSKNDEWNKNKEPLDKLQYEYMEQVLEEYEDSIKGNKAKQYIYDALHYVVKQSVSGKSIVDIYDDNAKEIADEIDNIIWEEIGDYLLDYQVYEEDDHYVLDIIVAGNYCPEWNGWEDMEVNEL